MIQVFHSEHLATLASKQHNHLIELEPVRGIVFDRNLHPLAFNVPVYSLFANPRAMSSSDKEKAVAYLPKILKVDPIALKGRLDNKKYFVWIKRKISQADVTQIKALKIDGLGFRRESKRFYPNGTLAAHIIGFAGVDNEGLEGLELYYNQELKGKPGWMTILRDARQKELMMESDFIPPHDGFHLVLTIDETIQYIAERALEKAYIKHNAKAASIIVMDIKTGEILALANRPTYDLDNLAKANVENRTNRAISFVYEPGSVFKIVATAAALDTNAFKEDDKIYCENGAYKVANHILHDHEKLGLLTFKQVIEQSSNIGVTKVAQKMGPAVIYEYANKFRFGKKTNIDILGEVRGNLKHPNRWSKTTIGAIPIGHEVTVTPLQLVCAISAIANDGVYMQPYVVKYILDGEDQIIKNFEPRVVDRVISSETSKRVTEVLTGVVENGTGKRAQIPGIKVAGKTGTAQKIVGNVYSHDSFDASFIGFAPSDNPRLAAVVVVDSPHPSYYGGTVAAPVFQEVIEDSLKYLQVTESVEEEEEEKSSSSTKPLNKKQ